MISAIDTNILLDVLVPGAGHVSQSTRTIHKAAVEGDLIICDIVFGELAAAFENRMDLEAFLDGFGVRTERVSPQALFEAGETWRRYTRQRPRSYSCPSCGTAQVIGCSICGQEVRIRQHLVADFVIGAHAMERADQLLTRDRGYYATYFPELRVIS